MIHRLKNFNCNITINTKFNKSLSLVFVWFKGEGKIRFINKNESIIKIDPDINLKSKPYFFPMTGLTEIELINNSDLVIYLKFKFQPDVIIKEFGYGKSYNELV